MESGLEGRNNWVGYFRWDSGDWVSMESGLEGRNNAPARRPHRPRSTQVSMESGLEGRNNDVRLCGDHRAPLAVSMESGLEGRNNATTHGWRTSWSRCLNGVRPRRPEQCLTSPRRRGRLTGRLNGVRPRRPEQCDRIENILGSPASLNGVRPRRPEQFFGYEAWSAQDQYVSMESGLEGRNNIARPAMW